MKLIFLGLFATLAILSCFGPSLKDVENAKILAYGSTDNRFYGLLTLIFRHNRSSLTWPRLGYPGYDMKSEFLFSPLRLTNESQILIVGSSHENKETPLLPSKCEKFPDGQRCEFKTVFDYEKLEGIQIRCEKGEVVQAKLFDGINEIAFWNGPCLSNSQRILTNVTLMPFSFRRGADPFFVILSTSEPPSMILRKFNLQAFALTFQSLSPFPFSLYTKVGEKNSFDLKGLRDDFPL